MEYSTIQKKLMAHSGIAVEQNVLLKNYTSFGIGGPAKWFAQVNSKEAAAKLVAASRALSLPLLFIGGGTNLLVSDDGFEGLAIVAQFNEIHISDGNIVTVGAAMPVSQLVTNVVSQGLAGMEFAAGLPGTVGGAVAGNAGCFGCSFGDVLTSALVLTNDGSLEMVDATFFQFDYRKTALRENHAFVVEASFQLAPGNTTALHDTAQSHIDLRRTKHPSKGMKTAGSYFKNLPPLRPGEHRRAAGMLLEQVGAKSVSVGDAAVFEKHANILVNHNNATAKDMLTLEHRLKRMVAEEFNIVLEPEVRFVGNRPVIDE